MNNLKQIIIFILLFFIQNIYATNLDVNINIPSGTYDNILKIELTPTDLNAKTFFSFNPNGTPNDAFLYTGAIIIKKSTPIIYWSFLDVKTESKIKQNNYILNFSNNIILNAETIYENGKIRNLKILNTDLKEIDISFWEIKKDGNFFVIPDNTIIKSNASFMVPEIFTGTGFISLYSPNGEKKDFVEIIENNKQEVKQIEIINNKIVNKNLIKDIKDKTIETNIVKTNINTGVISSNIIKTDIAENENIVKDKTIETNIVKTDYTNSNNKTDLIASEKDIVKGTILTVETKENIKQNTNDNLVNSTNLGQNLKISSKENLNFIKNDKLIFPLIICITLIIGILFRLYIFYFKN